ncbi:MAG: ribosome small subunit-dependent GTPase A [Saccharofermentanales bacterium]
MGSRDKAKSDKDEKSKARQMKNIRGRILKGVGGSYQILTDDGRELTAKPRGILRKTKTTPYPGDFVDISYSDEETIRYNIDGVYPRTTFLTRPAIANLDHIIITSSATAPRPDCFFIDKLMILCNKAGIEASLCITKADLDRTEADLIYNVYSKTGIRIFILGETAEFLDDFDNLRKFITGKTVSFSGQSGVGKSTLLNKLMQKLEMPVGEVSEKIGKGRHTTRHSQIFPYRAGFLADTPGFSSLELEDLEVTGDDVLKGYPEIEKIEGMCRFTGCRHIGETGCAIDEDEIDAGRLSRYRQFRKLMDAIQPYEFKKKEERRKEN